VKVTKIRKRVSYWTITNPVYRIKERYACNLSEFCRIVKIDVVRLRALIQTARLANETSATMDDWTITWHYESSLRSFLDLKSVPISPETERYEVEVPVLKKHKDKNDDAFDALMLRLNNGAVLQGKVKR